MEGVDYSFSRPDPRSLANAGKRFAVRYVGTPNSGKNLTPDEAVRLRGAGIDPVATYETSAGFMLSADGASAARRALIDALSCGMPEDRPIYFALDVDPRALSGGQWSAVVRFLDSAASVIGRSRVGVYGGYDAIERLVPDHAPWGWQTYAWSGGRWSDKAQLQQYRNGVSLAGGTVDLCRSMAADFGQWGRSQEEDPMTPEERKWLDGELAVIRTKVENTYNQVNIRTGALSNKLSALAAVVQAQTPGDVDEDQLAALVVDALGEAFAAKVGDEISRRMAT